MKVKQTKVGDANQVLVECWASKINNLSEIDIVFTYDKTVLQPSYINGEKQNAILDGIETIKWESRPDVIDPSTQLSNDEELDFQIRNKNLLSNSFEFNNGYGSDLYIFAFHYLATEGNNEAINFVTKKTSGAEITTTDPVLLGTFSFRKISDVSLEGTFSTKYIGITSNENNEDRWDIRDITGVEGDTNCEELVVFVYEKYGSISGTLDLADNAKRNKAKKVATIKVFEKSKVAYMDWSNLSTYKANRLNLPEPDYCFDSMQESDDGKFKVDKILKGEYIILIDKKNFLDYVITGVVIEGTNDNVNLDEILNEGIILYPGDTDKDGKVTVLDRNAVNKAYGSKDETDTYDINDTGKVEILDRNMMNKAYNEPNANKLMKFINLINN